jgi:hypothetical protein
MHVLRVDGMYGVVTGWRVVPGSEGVYNLTVAYDHTFVVGTNQWVVYNTCPLTANVQRYIFEGDLRNGQAGGYHWEGDPSAPGAVNGPRTPPDIHGVYEAPVEVSGVPKISNGGLSSFFLLSMSRQDVLDSIEEAYNNRVYLQGNRWAGEISTGMVIQIFINTATGDIISAFP